MSEDAEDERGRGIAEKINKAVGDFVKKAGPLRPFSSEVISEYITAVVRVAINTATPLIWNYAVSTVADAIEAGEPKLDLTEGQSTALADWIRSQQ